jgi:hypothetical protein
MTPPEPAFPADIMAKAAESARTLDLKANLPKELATIRRNDSSRPPIRFGPGRTN